MSSVYDVPCMYVRIFVIRDGMLAGSYVCTYGALLGIRLTEGCQSVGNKRASCLLYTSPSPRDRQKSRMPSSA